MGSTVVTRKSGLQPYSQRYPLQDAKVVVGWMNAATLATLPSYKNFLSFKKRLEAFTEATGLYDKAHDKLVYGPRRPEHESKAMATALRGQWFKLERQHKELNRRIAAYTFHPYVQFTPLTSSWRSGMMPETREEWFCAQIDGQLISEADAVMALVRLYVTDNLKLVILCEGCKTRWRVRGKSHFKFCGPKCRKQFYARAPGYHANRVAIQQRYRNNLKKKIENERAAAAAKAKKSRGK